MGRVDLPYVDAIRVKGRLYHYYRRDGLRRRLPGQPGEPEFMQAYQRMHALAQAADNKTPAGQVIPGSMRALVAAYRASPEWAEKQPGTKINYEKSLKPLEDAYGALPVATLPRSFVFGLRDKYSQKPGLMKNDPPIQTPRRANGMIAVLSLLLSWAVDRGWRSDNPALRPKKLRTGQGYRAWTDAELNHVLAASSTSAEVRTAMLLAVGTGQRGQDLIAMTWAAFDGSAVEVTQLKGKAKVWVPLHAQARHELAGIARRGPTILTRPDGNAWKIDHFRHAMGAAIKDAGLSGVVTHGLRATAAKWMAEAGCSEREIMSITGHTTSNMVSRYVREAEQKTRAKGAADKVERHQRNNARMGIAKPTPDEC